MRISTCQVWGRSWCRSKTEYTSHLLEWALRSFDLNDESNIDSGVRCSPAHKICCPVDTNPSSFFCPKLPQIPMSISIQVRPDIVGTLTAEGKVNLHLHSIIFFRWQKTGDFGSFGSWLCCLLLYNNSLYASISSNISFFCEAWLVGFLVDGLQSILWGKELVCDLHPRRRWTRNSQSTHADTETSENTKPLLLWWTHLIVENKHEKPRECRVRRKSWILGGCLNFLPTFLRISMASKTSCASSWIQLKSRSLTALCWHRLLDIWRPERASYMVGRGKPRPSTVALPPAFNVKDKQWRNLGRCWSRKKCLVLSLTFFL